MVSKSLKWLSVITLILSSSSNAYENPQCGCGHCGILYNDSSSGRFVMRDGYYSQCYSTRHAVMDLQKFKGCCMWQGGVEKMDAKGRVICRDKSISELCTLQNPKQSIAVF